MIKANVISGNLKWKRIIKKPDNYIGKRLKILSTISSFKRKNYEFSILLTNDKEMKNLNYKFRKKTKLQMFYLSQLKLKIKKCYM